jgi:hypothetical protein
MKITVPKRILVQNSTKFPAALLHAFTLIGIMGLLGGILVAVAAQSNSPMRSAACSSASLSEQRESVDELLQLGIEQFRQYNLKEAEKTFQRVLALRQQQAAGLNLYGTQLVVLSACETGLGNVANGEGVYELRRAFVTAGAESQLMSLWKVDDYGTSELMSLLSLYYQRLKNGEGRSEALRQVQLEMMQAPAYQHPYYWASFIFSGDWREIGGL